MKDTVDSRVAENDVAVIAMNCRYPGVNGIDDLERVTEKGTTHFVRG